MEQDGFLLVGGNLYEPESSEQKNTLNSQQCVTDFSNLAIFRSKRIEQSAVMASHRLQHVRGVHQGGYEKSRLLGRGVVLVQCFLDIREDQFDRPSRSTAQSPTYCLLKTGYFSF
ncbi:hypothetical protein P3T23_006101 [Paraburkholderia sp. GAS448]